MITTNFFQALYNLSNNAYYTRLDGGSEYFYQNGAYCLSRIYAISNTLPFPSNTSKLMLGTGTTLPARTDYCLASPVNESLFSVSASSQSQTADKKIALTQTYQYNGSGEISITEVGLVANVNGVQFMLARTLLDNPITVNNGDTFTVSMAIG